MSEFREPLTRVDILLASNAWWDDAFQYGQSDDQTWNFNGCTFSLGVKVHPSDTSTVAEFTSGAGTILVLDPINRVLQMNVANANGQVGGLSPGCYWYDLIMITTATGERDGLMYGQLEITTGVTP